MKAYKWAMLGRPRLATPAPGHPILPARVNRQDRGGTTAPRNGYCSGSAGPQVGTTGQGVIAGESLLVRQLLGIPVVWNSTRRPVVRSGGA